MARICAYLLALGFAASCGGKSAPATLVPSSYRGGTPALRATAATEFLYPDTNLVVVADSVAMLERKLGWSNLAKLVGIDMAELADPAAMAKIGIDTDAAIGLAITDDATLVLFASLRNADTFTAAVESFGKRHGAALQVSKAGEGVIFLPSDDRYAVVIRDRIAFVVCAAGARSIRDLTAVRLASVPRSSSLATDPGFRAATDDLAFGGDIAGYLAVARLTAPYLEPSAADDKLESVASELRLRLAKDPANSAARDQQALIAQIRHTRASKRELIARLSRQLAVGFAIELSPDRVLVKLVAPAPQGGLLSQLVTTRSQPHQVLGRISGPPLLLLTAHADPTGLIDLGELWAGTRGTTRSQVKEWLSALLGETGTRELETLMSGEAALAVSAEDRAEPTLDLLLGVTDGPRAESLLAHARKTHPDLVHDQHVDLTWPGFAPLHVDIGGAAVVASSKPPPPSQPHGWSTTNPDISELVTAAAAALLVADGRLVAGLLVPDGLSRNSPTVVVADPELNRINSAINAKLAQIDARTRQHAEDQGQIIGTLALRIIREDDTIVGFGGQYPNRPLIEVSSELARLQMSFASDRANLVAAVRQLLLQRDALRSSD